MQANIAPQLNIHHSYDLRNTFPEIISSAFVSTCIYMCVVYIYRPIVIPFIAYFFLNFEIGPHYVPIAGLELAEICLPLHPK